MKTRTFWFKLALVVLMLLFIWGNSLLPASLSNRESGWFLKLTGSLISAIQRIMASHGIQHTKNYIVRKMAHFTEFAVLGFLMTLLLMKPGLRSRILPAAALCLGAALVDEGIQMFIAGRGPSLKDVLLDFCGAAVGIAFTAAVVAVARVIRLRSMRQNE